MRQPLASYGVVGDDLEAGHVHEEGVKPLRMLRALAPALADDGAHDERHVHLAAVHVVALRRDVHQLVHREHQEIHADVDVNGPQPTQCRADRRAGHGVLGQRRAEHAARPEFFDQSLRGALKGLGIIHVQTEEDHGRIAFHFLMARFADGLSVGDLSLHRDQAALKISVQSSIAPGNGLSSANLKASAISCSTAVSMAWRSARSSRPAKRATSSFSIHGPASARVR